MKTCSRCEKLKDDDEFGRNRSRDDGLQFYCKQCRNSKQRADNKTLRGRAITAWNNIVARVENLRGDRPTYAMVELRMTREEFLAWVIPAYGTWTLHSSLDTATVDRIENSGHYEIGNLRLATYQEQAQNQNKSRNSRAPQGTAWCSTHQDYLSVAEFHQCPGRSNGLSANCKDCESLRHRRQRQRQLELQVS